MSNRVTALFKWEDVIKNVGADEIPRNGNRSGNSQRPFLLKLKLSDGKKGAKAKCDEQTTAAEEAHEEVAQIHTALCEKSKTLKNMQIGFKTTN